MDDLFNFQTLQIRQPGRLLAGRANYEVFDAQRQLLAVATETEARARLKLFSESTPSPRVLTVAGPAGEPILTLIKHVTQRVTELQGPGGHPAGQIKATHLNRHYTLIDTHGQTVGKVVGDLALKHFPVTAPDGRELARIRKTFAGVTKEMLTASDHYQVDFAGPTDAQARVLTVMMAIVLDLTLYEPE